MTAVADAVADWLAGGEQAIMLITSATQYADASDPSYVTETGQLLAGMRCDEMAVTVAWLARMAGQAIIDKHHGSLELAREELRQIGLAVQSAAVEVATVEDVAD